MLNFTLYGNAPCAYALDLNLGAPAKRILHLNFLQYCTYQDDECLSAQSDEYAQARGEVRRFGTERCSSQTENWRNASTF